MINGLRRIAAVLLTLSTFLLGPAIMLLVVLGVGIVVIMSQFLFIAPVAILFLAPVLVMCLNRGSRRVKNSKSIEPVSCPTLMIP